MQKTIKTAYNLEVVKDVKYMFFKHKYEIDIIYIRYDITHIFCIHNYSHTQTYSHARTNNFHKTKLNIIKNDQNINFFYVIIIN